VWGGEDWEVGIGGRGTRAGAGTARGKSGGW